MEEVNTIHQLLNNLNIDRDKKLSNVPFENIAFPKPIIKWVGGKSKLLDKLFVDFPENVNNYYELFLGGGSVLLALLHLKKNNHIKIRGKIYAFDLNETLIYLYINIQKNHQFLYQEIQKLIQDYNNCEENGVVNRKPKNIDEAKTSKESYYYWIRSSFNSLSQEEKKYPKCSAMFIFLNKTCFRGLYRMGPNGFNVPFGNYRNPEILNKEHLDEIHELIQGVHFECLSYKDAILKIKNNDFCYMDPPYVPEKEGSFVGYNEGGFDLEEHKNLFKLSNELNTKNIKFMMSNADVEFVRNQFVHSNFKIKSIECRRAINAKKPDSKTKEVVIINY